MAKDFKENWESIKTYWNTKVGLFFLIFVFITIYYTALKEFISENIIDNKVLCTWIIPTVFLIIICLVWAFSSHRINLFKSKTVTTGIFLKCDDPTSEYKIKQILNDLLDEMKEEFVEIKFKLFPINHITSKIQLDRFVAGNNHIIDNAFFAKIYSGNCIEDSQTVTKIEIQNILFSAQLNEIDKSDFRNNINMSFDLSLRNLDKQWQYVESKSFADKNKMKYNFKDSLLFFNGLYSIYKKEYDLALKIFKNLKQSETDEQSEINYHKKSRLNDILLSLFTFNAVEKYIVKKDLKTSFNLLKEYEILFKENHRFSFSNYITLSRMYYEKGEYDVAKEYTYKAYKLKKYSPAINCNLGFFGMVENNPEQVFLNYSELAHTYKFQNNINFIEIIDFIELHKSKYINHIYLFDFAIATLNYLYADKDLGKKQLIQVQDVLRQNLTCINLYNLSVRLIEKGGYKSSYYQRRKNHKAG